MTKYLLLSLVLFAVISSMSAYFHGRSRKCYDTQCPRSWIGYRGHCYRFISRAGLNWYRAKDSCNLIGGYLARVTDAEENQWMKIQLTALRTGDSYFFGGTDESTEGTFFWESNGMPVKYNDFNIDQPTGQRDDCLAYYRYPIAGYKWIDRICHLASNYGYICEADADCLDDKDIEVALTTLPINESEVNATLTMI